MSATVNGAQCSTAEVTIPRYGVPWGRAEMTDAAEVPAAGAQVLVTIASIPMLCTVVEAGERGGVTSLEFVGGYGGWRSSPAEPVSYRDDGILSVATVAEKLAVSVGESLIPVGAAERSVGSHLAVPGGDGAPPASAILSQICALPEGSDRIRWYVDPAGVTRLGERFPLPEIDAIEVDRDPRGAWVAFAEENALGMLPGATFNGREIAELRIEAKPESVRQVVTFTGDEPQSLAAKFWRTISDIVRPWFLWRTFYTYRVTRIRPGNRPDLVPVSSRVAPRLEAVRIWPGIGGAITAPTVGALCLVTFADGSPSAPVIVGWQPQLATSDQKWKPTRTDVDATLVVLAAGTKPAGRGGWRVRLSTILGNLAITFTDPDGGAHTWLVSGAAAGSPVVFTVAPSAGVDPLTNTATIDAGRAEVRV